MDDIENRSPLSGTVNRRRLLGVAGALAVGGAGLSELRKLLESKEQVGHRPEFVGFNTNLYAVETVPDDLSLRAFMEDTTTWAEAGLNSGRFTIRADEIAPAGSADHIEWNETNFDVYRQAIEHAKEKGIKIFLASHMPSFASEFPPDDFLAVASNYFGELTRSLGDGITSLQIANEPNVHGIRRYWEVPELTDKYLDEVAALVDVASDAIQTANPNVLPAINVGGYPLNDELIGQWTHFLDHITHRVRLKVIGLDFYPDRNVAEIERLGERVTAIKDRYTVDGEPPPIVIAAEFGLPSRNGPFNEAEQGEYVGMMSKVLLNSDADGVFPYAYRDENRNNTNQEGAFGIIWPDGIAKSSYGPIMGELMPKDNKKRNSQQDQEI